MNIECRMRYEWHDGHIYNLNKKHTNYIHSFQLSDFYERKTNQVNNPASEYNPATTNLDRLSTTKRPHHHTFNQQWR